MCASYKNPWHKPGKSEYGPQFYTTDARPTHYKGYLIYHVKPNQYDVVKDGACVSQRAGPRGARDFIDGLEERKD